MLVFHTIIFHTLAEEGEGRLLLPVPLGGHGVYLVCHRDKIPPVLTGQVVIVLVLTALLLIALAFVALVLISNKLHWCW